MTTGDVHNSYCACSENPLAYSTTVVCAHGYNLKVNIEVLVLPTISIWAWDLPLMTTLHARGSTLYMCVCVCTAY